MSGFSEAWLREYRAKRDVREDMRAAALWPLVLQLPAPFTLMNVTLREHWAVRGRRAKAISADLAWRLANMAPRAPLARARVVIERHSTGTPDKDGLYGGAKPLLDALLVRSATHPHGLGLIVDDSPAHLDLDVRAVKCKRAEQCTIVRIEPA